MIKKAIKAAVEIIGYNIHKLPKKEVRVPILEAILGDEYENPKYKFCFEGKDIVEVLQRKVDAKIKLKARKLEISMGELTFQISSWEELLILKEVFVEGIYNYKGNGSFTLIDIGMNVGITSLFFSINPNCQEIFSFEPFVPTIEKAKNNFKYNKSSEKIVIQNYGLGYPARTIPVEYSEKYKGSVGINGVASYIQDATDEHEILDLHVIDVGTALKPIIEQAKSTVIKIDCEGAEYEILDRLEEVGLVDKIAVYMIEWHIKGPFKLKEILESHGFRTISFNDHSSDIGMIYAFKAT